MLEYHCTSNAQNMSTPCTQCNRTIDILETFPGGLCLQCHARKVEKEPLTKPDFIGTIKI